MPSFNDVIDAVREERAYQDAKWGALHEREQSIPGFMLVLKKELEEAENGWIKNNTAFRSTALEELIQVAAVAIACLEKHGLYGNG